MNACLSLCKFVNLCLITNEPPPIKDADDLPFKKGELLHVINKDEDQWWTARNALGMVGQIPVPYVQKVSINL